MYRDKRYQKTMIENKKNRIKKNNKNQNFMCYNYENLAKETSLVDLKQILFGLRYN